MSEDDVGRRPAESADGMENLERVALEAECSIDATRPLEQVLNQRIVGQDHAVEKLVCSYARLLAGLHDADRPLLTALLLGPTGVGKTETARALAYALFGSEGALTRVNCEEYAEGHELSKLLGSPPGYVGHDIEPILSQDNIEMPHLEARSAGEGDPREEAILADRMFGSDQDRYESIILFDEIEKAHPKLWNGLLGVLEDGSLTLGDNSVTDFTRSIILLTSNVGSRQMTEQLESQRVGFHAAEEKEDRRSEDIEKTARSRAEAVFPFEFLNRLDEVMVYEPLDRESLDGIFDKFLGDIQERTVREGDVPVLLKVSPEAREWILDEGTDLRYGARPLRRAMETHLVDPLSRLIASEQLEPGDVLEVERDDDQELSFYRVPRESDALVA